MDLFYVIKDADPEILRENVEGVVEGYDFQVARRAEGGSNLIGERFESLSVPPHIFFDGSFHVREYFPQCS